MTFKAGNTIRNIRTGKPFLVVQAFKAAILVVDLESSGTLATPQVILNRDLDQWDEDYHFEEKRERGKYSLQQFAWA